MKLDENILLKSNIYLSLCRHSIYNREQLRNNFNLLLPHMDLDLINSVSPVYTALETLGAIGIIAFEMQ